jgi:hypothetical protein
VHFARVAGDAGGAAHGDGGVDFFGCFEGDEDGVDGDGWGLRRGGGGDGGVGVCVGWGRGGG